MAKAVTVQKPALAKGAAKPAAKPALAKPVAKKPEAKAEKAPKPPKEIKPFIDGEIVTFKGYTQKPAKPLFTEGEELAVVEQTEENGVLMISCVKASQYHKYKADENSVDGEQLTPAEVKRTGKTVPAPYQLVPVGDMAKKLKDHDPLEVAIGLYNDAQQSFFYLGGVLNKLYREMDDDSGLPLFCSYQDASGKNYENSKDGFEVFLKDNFGTEGELSSMRKAQYFMAIYDSFSNLKDAPKLIAELPKVGWWKAARLAQYITDDNATQLVQIAQEQTDVQLTETLKTQYTTEGNTAKGTAASRHTIKRTTFTFKLYEDAGVALELILKAAGKQLGMQDTSQVFEHIVQEWASEHLGDAAAKAKAATERARAQLKKQGVKLPADHPAAATEKKAA
jgi:hypothetical protein